MNESAALLAPRSRLREWLRYDESLEPLVDAAFADFADRSHLPELFALGFVLMLMAAGVTRSLHASTGVVFGVSYAALYLPMVFGLSRVSRHTWSVVLRGAADPGRTALYALGLAIAALGVEGFVSFVLALLHLRDTTQSIMDGGIAIAIVSAVLVAPICEEAFFQGWLQGSFEGKYRDNSGLLTTIAFVIYHIPRTIGSCVRFFGLYSHAIVRRDTRSLGGPIIGHAFVNAAAVSIAILYRYFSHKPLHW